ncbi:MAG: hypothetical protein Q8L51_01100 [Candidatus Amesbacteria bacterium]|nr:hypothetical protein [Candidatus Amesbacteria bacterium]
MIFIILGIILRFVLMPIVYHPDVRAMGMGGYLISQKGQVTQFYDYLSRQPRDDRWVEIFTDGLFIYPPLAYWVHGLFMSLTSPVYPFTTLLALLNEAEIAKTLPTWNYLLFMLKVPYLVLEAVLIFAIYKLTDPKYKKSVLIFCMLNPVVLYSAYAMGQFDILIGYLVVIAALGALRSSYLSAVLLGIASGFKPFPLFLLPMLGTNIKAKIISVLVGLATYGFIISPYLRSVAFKHYALLASQTDKLDYAKILVSGSQYLSLFWLGIILLYWWNWYKPQHLPIWGWFTAILLLFYSVTNWHPQWLTRVSILLIISLIQNRRTRLPIAVLFCVATVILLSFYTFIPDQAISMARAIFAATSIVTVLKMRES